MAEVPARLLRGSPKAHVLVVSSLCGGNVLKYSLFLPIQQLHFVVCRGMAGLEVIVKLLFNGFIIRNSVI